MQTDMFRVSDLGSVPDSEFERVTRCGVLVHFGVIVFDSEQQPDVAKLQ